MKENTLPCSVLTTLEFNNVKCYLFSCLEATKVSQSFVQDVQNCLVKTSRIQKTFLSTHFEDDIQESIVLLICHASYDLATFSSSSLIKNISPGWETWDAVILVQCHWNLSDGMKMEIFLINCSEKKNLRGFFFLSKIDGSRKNECLGILWSLMK